VPQKDVGRQVVAERPDEGRHVVQREQSGAQDVPDAGVADRVVAPGQQDAGVESSTGQLASGLQEQEDLADAGRAQDLSRVVLPDDGTGCIAHAR